MKTISQIAKEYGVTTQAIRKRLTRLATKLPTATTKVVNQVLYINPDGERILTEGLTPVETVVANQVDNQVASGCQPVDNQFLTILSEQIREKDKQIAELILQNGELIKKIEYFQILMGNAQGIKALPVEETPSASVSMTKGERDEKPRGGFLKKIFGRGK